MHQVNLHHSHHIRIRRKRCGRVDIPGEFLQTKASDGTIIKLQGAIVVALLRINPTCKKFIVYKGKKITPTIYSEAINDVYGIVDASKFFFEKLNSFLFNDFGFIANPYDAYVENKTISGRQYTISWHVNNLKLLHKESKLVTSIIEPLSKNME